MSTFDIKTKFSSLKLESITVIKLKAIAKHLGVKGYNKLRKAESIHKLETHPDVIEQVDGNTQKCNKIIAYQCNS